MGTLATHVIFLARGHIDIAKEALYTNTNKNKTLPALYDPSVMLDWYPPWPPVKPHVTNFELMKLHLKSSF